MPVPRYRLMTIIALSSIVPICYVPGAGAQTHYSARIYALGGSAVSGIIPDYYTDLMFNPAYASLSDGFTINYGQRESPVYRFPFLQFNMTQILARPETGQYRTNELLAHGIRLRGCDIALISEWFIDTDDETDSYPEVSYSGLDFTNTLSSIRNNNENNYMHAAVSCSRRIGEDRILGLRIGAFDCYYHWTQQVTKYTERYQFTESYGETYLHDTERRHDYDEKTRRWLSPYLQVGLLSGKQNGNDSELMFRISQDEVNVRAEDFFLDIKNGYQRSTGTRTSYDYSRFDWIEDKDGTMWSFDLWGRHTFANGFRIFAGGGYHTAAYDGDWIKTRRDYEWRSFTTDFISYQAITGEGDFTEYSIFVKGGKTFRLERRIDVTAGFSGSFCRSLNEEEPTAQFKRKTVYDIAVEETSVTCPSHFEMERIHAQLVIPVAVEFRPAGYFTLFAGFTTQVGWIRDTEAYLIPPIYIESARVPSGAPVSNGTGRMVYRALEGISMAENAEDEIQSDYSATVGFSLNYKNSLVFDLYSGSSLTPGNMLYLILDLRYRF